MIISNSNMTQLEENEDFLKISVPLVVSKKFNDIIIEIQAIQERYQQTSLCLKLIMNIQAVLHKVTKKLKSQKMMFFFSEILEANYIVALKNIKLKETKSENIFQQWVTQNFEQVNHTYIYQFSQDYYVYVRTMNRNTHMRLFRKKTNTNQSQFSDQVSQSLQNIKILYRFNLDFDENKLYNEMITQVCCNCKSRSFYSFLINIFEEKEMITQSDLLAQLKLNQQNKTLTKISSRKQMYHQDLPNSKDNLSIKCNTASLENFISDCSYGSVYSQTPIIIDKKLKDQSIFTYLKQATINNFKQRQVSEKIDTSRGFLSLTHIQNKTDQEDSKKNIQPFILKQQIDKSLKSEEQQSVKSGNEKEIQKESSVLQQKAPQRTIGQGFNARYKIAMQVQKIDVQQSKLNIRKEVKSLSTRNIEHNNSHRKSNFGTSQNKQKILDSSESKTQIKFCQEVVQRLTQIRQNQKDLHSGPIFHDNILALNTPNKDMEDESQFNSRSYPYF